MDLFHSPAGFVQLSLSYGGATPEVMAIPAPPPTEATDADVPNSEVSELLASEFDKIEFPNPNIVSENHMIVSEYYGIQSSESLVSSDTENHLGPKIDSHAVEDLSKGIVNLVQISRPEGNAELQREIKRFFAIILCRVFTIYHGGGGEGVGNGGWRFEGRGVLPFSERERLLQWR
ncbi:hypothetical protein LguiA_024076 [Lonicera macranthoides]